MDKPKPGWVTEGIDLDRPNPARIYDYLLGGHHNFAVDRAAAEKLLEHFPVAKEGAVAQRAFLRRVIGMVTSEGVDQFLDIGSGLPTVGNVHDLARAAIPEARVVYVDVDPVVIAHSAEMLRDDPLATIVEGDVRYPEAILEHPEVGEILDFERPVSLTMTSMLHFVEDDAAAFGATRTLISSLASGSYVTISHCMIQEHTEDLINSAIESYRRAANTKARWREDIKRFFNGLEIVEPGLVPGPEWRPEHSEDLLLEDAGLINVLVGVGRKP